MKPFFRFVLYLLAGFVITVFAWVLLKDGGIKFENYTAWIVMAAIAAMVYLVVRITGSTRA